MSCILLFFNSFDVFLSWIMTNASGLGIFIFLLWAVWTLSRTMSNYDHRLDMVESRLDNVEKRLDNVEKRLDRLEARMDKLEERMDRLEGRMDRLEEKVDLLINHLIPKKSLL